METIRKMFEHLNWANQRILSALQQNKNVNQEVTRLFSHILQAEKVWLTRLRGMDSTHIAIWTDDDLTACAELVRQNEQQYTTYLDGLTAADLDREISYCNSKGTEFKTSLRDILTHVALHGQYHRGQINTRLRTTGEEPVNVDFITFVR